VTTDSVSVPARPAARPAGTILSGVDALVRLLLLRRRLDERDGLNTATMVSGYPGSPLGAFDLALDGLGAQALAAHRIVHRPGLNEELAAATVWGSQMGAVVPYDGVDGVAGAWYGKGPGLDRSGDALKHANSMGAGRNGGAVVFCGDDPGSKSSTLACDSQYTFEDACIPVLYPGDQQDVLDLGVHAFRMSRYCGAWVGLKIVTAVADGIGTVDLDPERHHPANPDGLVIDGLPWEHRPLATVGPHAVPDQEALVLVRRLRAAQEYARRGGLDRVAGAPPGAALGLVCAGKTYFDVLEALALLGVSTGDLAVAGIRILRLAMTFPLVTDTVLEFAASVDEIVVIEEKRPFVETQLRAILHEDRSAVPVRGKRDASGEPLVSSVGELGAAAIAASLTRVRPTLGDLAAKRDKRAIPLQSPNRAQPSHNAPAPDRPAPDRTVLPLLSLPVRAPGYCSGCPHNRSTVLPDGAFAGGGVGCHGIMYFEARQAGGRRLPPPPMGAEGVPWLGLSPFVAEPHVIQNLGDGTLSHSGTLAIRASVAAGADITFKILYNAAVAMTGGQHVTGLLDVPALTRALEAEGVAEIVVCAEDPRRYGRKARWAPGTRVLGRDRLPEVQERLRAVKGVTVIIYDQRCAAEARRLRKRGQLATPPRRVLINEAVCEGCGDCGVKSNCLSVLPLSTEFGDKRQIHDPSCNRDYTCLEGDCPSFITITPKRTRPKRDKLSTGEPGAGKPSTGKLTAGKASADQKRQAKRAVSRAPARASVPTLPTGELPVPGLPAVSRRYGIYFTGIGGTGVVTANRIIAAAAEAAGFVIAGLDQTGLSQKAGAVVSHLHLAATRDDLGAAAVADGGADLYLSGDIYQAAAERHLAKLRPGETIVVIDRDVTPTAAMLQSAQAAPDVPTLEAAIRAAADAGLNPGVDAVPAASTVPGTSTIPKANGDPKTNGDPGVNTFSGTSVVPGANAVPAVNGDLGVNAAPGTNAVPAVGDGPRTDVGQRRERVAFVDAKRIADRVFNDHLLANVILLGAAFQLGGLPVTVADIDQAIGRQGNSAVRNRAAFNWGRWAVHDPSAVAIAIDGAALDGASLDRTRFGGTALNGAAATDAAPAESSGTSSADSARIVSGRATGGTVHPSGRPSGHGFEPSATALETARTLLAGQTWPKALHDPLTRRAAQMIDYQDANRARRFLGLVARVRQRDDATRDWALTQAVAESWFKLLTYKDEYEVARLHLAADYDQMASDVGIDGPYRVTYHLHPPFLRRLGLRKKLPLGTPYRAGFYALRAMKRLRGTAFDIAGWQPDRHTERSLITEYERLIDEVTVAPLPYETQLLAAESAQSIKGYAPVKDKSVAEWRTRAAAFRDEAAAATIVRTSVS